MQRRVIVLFTFTIKTYKTTFLAATASEWLVAGAGPVIRSG